MSLLPGDTFVNAGRALWAVAGSGGGGTSTLLSPVSVTPDVALGDSQISLTSAGTGTATVTLTSSVENSMVMTGGENCHIDLEGSTAAINFNPGLGATLLVQSNTSPNILQITNDAGLVPVATFDVALNTIQLGNPVVAVGATNSVVVNVPLTYSSTAGAPIAGFPPIVLSSTGGAFVQGDNTVALGGLARGLYVMIGDSGGSTAQADLDSRFNSIFQIDPAQTCSGGAGGADTGWNLSPNGTGGLTLNLTNAPTSAFSVKCFPLYLF